MVKRETILRVVHSAEVTSDQLVRALDFTRRQFPGMFSERYVDAVEDVTPFKYASTFTVQVQYDPSEFTPGDVANLIRDGLDERRGVECLVCRQVDGGCCEFGFDPKQAA